MLNACSGVTQQITKYVEREIINHKQLKHPHVVELREVRCASPPALAGVAMIACTESPYTLNVLAHLERK